MIGESSPISGVDAFARQLADYERRIGDLERRAASRPEGSWTPTPSIGSLGNSAVLASWRRDGMWCSFALQVAFGSTFDGGSVSAWTLTAPFPAAFEQAVTCKLYVASAAVDVPGVGIVFGSTVRPLVALSATNPRLGTIINADASSAPGTGQPSGIGTNYPMASPGNIDIAGTYRVQDGY